MREVIILAGGMGTRLKQAVPDLPKSMAPVHGIPFISYVVEYMIDQDVDKFIFSLGYMHEHISSYITKRYPNLNAKFIVEKEPLGTGGAFKLACEQATEKDIVAINGDSLYEINVKKLLKFHKENEAECTLALKPMKNFDRYGVVEIDPIGRITAFKEKQQYAAGLISGGFYALNVKKFLSHNFPEKFSMEKDYLEKQHRDADIFGQVQDQYFIDIGIPEDYEKFKSDMKARHE